MFSTKKTTLFEKPTAKKATAELSATIPTPKSTNAFLNAGLKTAAVTRSGNGALKYSTTGNSFVDQFGIIGSFKQPRSYDDMSRDMSTLWAENPYMTVAFTFYTRMITRKVQLFEGETTETVQRGAGLIHEGIMRMIWLNVNHPDAFYNNIGLWTSVASWKDIFTMMQYDLMYNGWNKKVLDFDKMAALVMAGLSNSNTSELVKKYLPTIRPKSRCNTPEAQADNIVAKWICSRIFGTKPDADELNQGKTYKLYRKLKTSGTAHEWQKAISTGAFDKLNFDKIHGRALSGLVKGKFLANQKLEGRYQNWISSKPVAKYTGFAHELFEKLPHEKYQIDTLNAQFNQLVTVAKQNAKEGTSLIVVRDTSSSMGSIATGTKMSCFNIAKALALFFSEMLPAGRFANSFIEFNSNAKMHTWKGSTPYEKYTNDRCNFVGGTNFQGVIDLFVQIKRTGVPESEFPTGILCISDSEFNPTQLGKTNVESALAKLKAAGFSKSYVDKFIIALWNLQSNYYGKNTGKKFETFGDVPNVYYMSGYEGSTVAFLTGVEGQENAPRNASELFEAAMNQEVMKLIKI